MAPNLTDARGGAGIDLEVSGPGRGGRETRSELESLILAWSGGVRGYQSGQCSPGASRKQYPAGRAPRFGPGCRARV